MRDVLHSVWWHPERRRWLVLAAGLVSAILVLNVVAFTAMAQAVPWMTLWDDDDSSDGTTSAVEEPERRGPPTLTLPKGSTPAEEVVRQTAAFVPAQLAKKRWSPSAPASGVSRTSLAFGCDPPGGPTPMVGRSRGWATSGGGPATQVAAGVTVAVQAYGAGGGGLAMQRLFGAVSACPSTYAAVAPRIGVQSLGFTSSDASTLAWRRGDVLVTMRFEQSSGPGSFDTMRPWARAYDARLEALLAQSCETQNAPASVSTRSPHLQPTRYQGRREFYEVELQVPEGAQTAEELTTAPARPIPAPDLGLPAQPYRPAPPASPYYPAFLPSEISRPVLPSAPQPAPTSGKAGKPIADPVGPGCGWDFTGQAAPRFDASGVRKTYLDRRRQVQQTLQQKWRRWQQAQADYWEAYDAYQAQAPAYRTYVEQTAAVTSAWAQIQAERDAYASALAARRAAIAARKQFFIDQERAQKRYDAAVAKCEQQQPSPEPEPSADPPSSGSNGNGNGDGQGNGQSNSDRGDSGSTDSDDAPRLQCPPERPAILDEEPPTIPPEPTPPADPRP